MARGVNKVILVGHLGADPESRAMPLLRFIPETTNVDFVKYRFIAFAIDGLLVLIAVISIAVHGFNLGIVEPFRETDRPKQYRPHYTKNSRLQFAC